MERVDLQVEAITQVHLISRYACYVQKATMTQTLGEVIVCFVCVRYVINESQDRCL